MSASEARTKDSAMAQGLKANGVIRTTSRCCICNKIIPTGAKSGRGKERDVLPDVTNHVAYQCKGPRAA